ncbi:MptD family putative ECF transporter S component [Nocardiopsis sp. RSe5-2]|uniref:MptD family putative ECF transporter S component n=1 Tax=Nocardiopsis endophytica TaxID=3018445 RepID=A0ABT4U2E8_9ACTN|nr:MptD family putative ECF transporter S component [Nocardiopsis endophytica]MDA2811123.1 MptD family putative ECF transporter S component [Nocardiopsis endophytica]
MPETTPPMTPAGPQARTPFRVHFSARDLVSVAIFAVIYFVVVFAIAMLGVVSPLVMLLTLPLSVLAGGIPYMLFLTRVRHAGMTTLFGVVLGLLNMMVGHPWQAALVMVAVSLAGELVLGAGRYRSGRAAIWACTVFSGWFIGPWVPFFTNRDEYLRSPAMEGMGEGYTRAFEQVVTGPAVLAMIAVALVCGFLGALLGTRLLRRHFRKAGLA